MKYLNLGILAHVDAGKTSLTERLLYGAGVINEIGSVDGGNTQTDSMALERKRGITIKSAVASFNINDVAINLLDTPGHPDFIAEVERVLSVLDGVVLVISAVEGVQAQTRILFRTLQRLKIPTLIFVNKIDRTGARYESLLQDIAKKLSPAIVPMGMTHDLGLRSASFRLYDESDTTFITQLSNVLADNNDAFLSAYVDDELSIPHEQLRNELAQQTKQALVYPVFFGSAITGAGVDSLMTRLVELLPTAVGPVRDPPSGSVFKIERGSNGEKIAYVRMFTGAIKARDQLQFGEDRSAKVTAISVFLGGSVVQSDSLVAGQIGKLSGLGDIKIGDTIGDLPIAKDQHYFAPPTLETVIEPTRDTDKGALRVALDQLAEQDPLINVRQDDSRQEISVSLYGEVQKEVIQDTLANEYGVSVNFRETTTICIERPMGIGSAVDVKPTKQLDLNVWDGLTNPFLAQVGLRVEPTPINTGVTFQLGKEVLGTMSPAFFKAVEETVLETLRQGIYGWQVTDCKVTMTHSGFWPRQSSAHGGFDKNVSSTARDFRYLTPLVLMDALKLAGVRVCEPMHQFNLEIPSDTLAAILPVLAKLGATPQTTIMKGSSYMLEGDIPAAHIHSLQKQLPGLTSGEGILECGFDQYEPVRGEAPMRQRWDSNPLNRREYLLRIMKGV
jgi:ribosomal protection tetracycline resistance protein